MSHFWSNSSALSRHSKHKAYRTTCPVFHPLVSCALCPQRLSGTPDAPSWAASRSLRLSLGPSTVLASQGRRAHAAQRAPAGRAPRAPPHSRPRQRGPPPRAAPTRSTARGLPALRLPRLAPRDPAPPACPDGGPAIPARGASGRPPISIPAPPHWAPLRPGPAPARRGPQAAPPCCWLPASPRRAPRADGRGRRAPPADGQDPGSARWLMMGSPPPPPGSGLTTPSSLVDGTPNSVEDTVSVTPSPSLYSGFSHCAGHSYGTGTGAEGFSAMLVWDDDQFVTSGNPALVWVPPLPCRREIEVVHSLYLLPNITRCLYLMFGSVKFAQLLGNPTIRCSKLLNS